MKLIFLLSYLCSLGFIYICVLYIYDIYFFVWHINPNIPLLNEVFKGSERIDVLIK
jgi:hypothetical protein